MTADEKTIGEQVTDDGKTSAKTPMETYDRSPGQNVAMNHFESRLSFLEQTVQDMAQRVVNVESLLQQVFQVSSAPSVPAATLLPPDLLNEGKLPTLH